jgi:NAD+ synthase (glutamine-hydrolysing)
MKHTAGDIDGNSAKMLDTAEKARARGAELVVFSELCLCGYLPQDLLERPAFLDRNREELDILARKLPIPAIIGYAGRAHAPTGKPVANSAALLAEGHIAFDQRKMLIPTFELFD